MGVPRFITAVLILVGEVGQTPRSACGGGLRPRTEWDTARTGMPHIFQNVNCWLKELTGKGERQHGYGMISTLQIFETLSEAMDPAAARKLAGILEAFYEDLKQTVTKTEFNELKAVVRDLADSVKCLEIAVTRLAEAQGRTEQRVEELAVAQGRTEQRVEELAVAQGRTEQRVEELAVAQGRTEQRVEELAVAQGRTEQRVGELAEAMGSLQKQVGGLSETVGGDIEDIAYIVLHDVLKRELGWDVMPLERSWQRWGVDVEEVDVFGQAMDPARADVTIWVVGEAKHNLTLKQVQRFEQLVTRARAHLTGEVFAVCFCYRARPEVQTAVKKAGLRLVFSYGKMV